MCNYLLSGLGWFGLSDTNTLAIRSMSFLISGSFKTFAKMLGCCTISFKHSPIASWISRSAGNKSRAVNWEKSRIIDARIWIVSFKKYLFWRFPCLYQNYSVYRSYLCCCVRNLHWNRWLFKMLDKICKCLSFIWLWLIRE